MDLVRTIRQSSFFQPLLTFATAGRLLALSIFAGYFLLIVALLGLIFRDIKSKWHNTDRRAYLFVFLAAISFAHTWTYMFKFMAWSFRDYEQASPPFASATNLERLTDWLIGTELFEQAWARVSLGKMNWWWSEQLCLFTVGTWTVFLSVEGYRRNITHLTAYMLLGQLVAISVASNLFYIAILVSPSPEPNDRPIILWARPLFASSILISLATIAATPFTNDKTFLPNLFVMHALLVVPLLFSQPSQSKSRFSVAITNIYMFNFATSMLLRLKSTVEAMPNSNFYALAWTTLHEHPAQSSIGWDVIYTSLSFIVWWSCQEQVDPMLSLTPWLSVATVAPYLQS
ncbi:hypothetical protein C8J56DRAFT_221925 [Mycena floridula]|nr:hypothetical protein C8J56DRAFT_221925 [Mycena floridula]